MLIFIPTYVFLALASWSALAAPLSGSESHNENVQRRSLSSGSSNLVGRLGPLYYIPEPTIGTSVTTIGTSATTKDCDNMSKSDSKSTVKGNGNSPADQAKVSTIPVPTVTSPSLTTSVGLPTISRRRFHSPMRRDSKAPETPSIFERDDPLTTREPVTVGDIVAYYLKRRAASRKRAMRPKTSRGAN